MSVAFASAPLAPATARPTRSLSSRTASSATTPARSAAQPGAATVRISLTVELPAGTSPLIAAQLADSLRSQAQAIAAPRGGRSTVSIGQGEAAPNRSTAPRTPAQFTAAPGQQPGAARTALPPRRGGLQPVPLRPRKQGVVSANAPARRDAQAAQLRILQATAVSPVSPASPATAGGFTSRNPLHQRGGAQTPSAGPHSPAGLVIDLYGRRVRIDGVDSNLTHREFELLAFLASNARSVVSRDALMEHVWCDPSGATGERTVDVHVRRVRNKLGRYRRLISTVRGSGYRLDPGSDVTILS